MSTTPDDVGRPARELSDDELEHQGRTAHETRNWVFLHGTARQFATHTARMLELEQEYLHRHPRRTWQGHDGEVAQPDPELALLRQVAGAPSGRMHKLEVHQLAREVGLERSALARLYQGEAPLLAAEGRDRVVTEAGRARVG